MPEPVDAWWARRQRSKGTAVPYEVGRFRADWQHYPVLVRQYHPDVNGGIALSQIPPAADVWLLWQCDSGHLFIATPWEQRRRPGTSRRQSTWCPECATGAVGRPTTSRPRRARAMCRSSVAERFAIGDPFVSECAPARASAVEADLERRIASRLEFTAGMTAIRVRQPFFDHLEVWPDVILPELRVAVEFDSTGRHGLEHVGRRERVDERKDSVLRAVGWEVIRVRTGKLPALGPHDLRASSISGALIERLLDELRMVRGSLIIDAYLR